MSTEMRKRVISFKQHIHNYPQFGVGEKKRKHSTKLPQCVNELTLCFFLFFLPLHTVYTTHAYAHTHTHTHIHASICTHGHIQNILQAQVFVFFTRAQKALNNTGILVISHKLYLFPLKIRSNEICMEKLVYFRGGERKILQGLYYCFYSKMRKIDFSH